MRRSDPGGVRQKLLLSLVGSVALVLWLPGRALAHVEVVPTTSAAGAMERYGIRVPTEKSVPTVRVEVQFPGGLRVLDLEVAPGWQVTVQTETGGRLVSAVWDGGSIPVGQFTEFGLRAQNPEREAELRWTVIQTYADGTEVQWVGPANAEFPAATTRVRSSDPLGSIDSVAAVAVLLALGALLVSVLAWRRLTSLKSYQGNQRRSSTSPRR